MMSLRERKYAQTKISIMDAVVRFLAVKGLAEITVKEICQAVEISEMTFFNYFPSKIDVIIYFVQVWSVRMQWLSQQKLAQSGSYLKAIERIFAETAAMLDESPRVMTEIVAFQASTRSPVVFQALSSAEYELLYPDCQGIKEFEADSLTNMLRQALLGAVDSGELPAGSDIELLTITLADFFFWTPVMALHGGLNPAEIYHRQLEMLWLGSR